MVAATIDGDAIVALCGTTKQLSLRRSADGGRGWTSRDVPVLHPALEPSPRNYHVAAHGRALAVVLEGAVDGPMVQVGEEPWSAVPSLLGVEMVTWWKAGSLCGALHLASRDQGVVIEQRRYAGEPHTILDLAKLPSPSQDPDGDRRVHFTRGLPRRGALGGNWRRGISTDPRPIMPPFRGKTQHEAASMNQALEPRVRRLYEPCGAES